MLQQNDQQGVKHTLEPAYREQCMGICMGELYEPIFSVNIYQRPKGAIRRPLFQERERSRCLPKYGVKKPRKPAPHRHDETGLENTGLENTGLETKRKPRQLCKKDKNGICEWKNSVRHVLCFTRNRSSCGLSQRMLLFHG